MTTTALRPEQQATLGRLTPKQRAFVLAYVGDACGHATEAARLAGYSHPDKQGPRLLEFVGNEPSNPNVYAAIVALRAPEEERAIMTADDLRRFWTALIRGDVKQLRIWKDGSATEATISVRDRIRASELLGKSLGAFLERHEISGPQQKPLVIQMTREECERLARTDPETDRTQH